MTLISFIIPVYKVEKYINQCVNSILNQTFKDFEVILVNDGSPDNCGSLCDSYSRLDKRVKVIHKENGGVSDARNKGLNMATGKYIIFVDGDDFLKSENNLLEVVKYLSSEPDFLLYNYCKYYEINQKYTSSNLYYQTKEYDNNTKFQLGNEILKSGTLPGGPWDKIIKREFLLSNDIYFEKGLLSEDIDWFLKLFLKANRISTCNTEMYVYRQQREGSITNTVTSKNVNDLFYILKKWNNILLKLDQNCEIRKLMYSFLAFEYCIILLHLKKTNISKSLQDEICTYNWLLNYDMSPRVKKIKVMNKIFKPIVTSRLLNIAYTINSYRLGRSIK